MNALGYAVKYGEHLYTLSGGTLEICPAWIYLWGKEVYQVHIHLTWNGKAYGGVVRLERRSAVSVKPWGHPDHPMVYQLAKALLELCKSLQSHGCDYALPE